MDQKFLVSGLDLSHSGQNAGLVDNSLNYKIKSKRKTNKKRLNNIT